MSRLYVKLFTGFFAHRKTLRLRAALGDDAFWVPPRLWAYAAEQQPDGVFEDYSAEEIASLIGYTSPTRDASSMLQALLKHGFMDAKPLRIHNWAEHSRYHQTFADRAKKAAAARWSKSPSTPTPEKEKEKERGASILQACLKHPPVLKPSDRISKEQYLKRIGAELKDLGALKDHDEGSKAYNRILELRERQSELRTILGVIA
jgi:hypothetical protein